MSVDIIINRIREEAEKEVQAIRAEEACDISNIRAHAEQKAEDAYNHRMAEGSREIRQMVAGRQSRSRIEANRRVRKVREDIISQCLSEVSENLKTIRQQDNYPDFFQSLLRECAENLGHSEVFVQVHPEDRLWAEEIILKMNKEGFSLHLSDHPVQTSGGVICERVSDNVVIDNTVETRFTRMQRDMIVIASEILFQNGES